MFDIDEAESNVITEELLQKNQSNKPGWVRLSLHPIMTNEELLFICDAIQQVVLNYKNWQGDYEHNSATNEYKSIVTESSIERDVKEWFWLE